MKIPRIKHQTIFYKLEWDGGVSIRLPRQNTKFKGHLKKMVVRF